MVHTCAHIILFANHNVYDAAFKSSYNIRYNKVLFTLNQHGRTAIQNVYKMNKEFEIKFSLRAAFDKYQAHSIIQFTSNESLLP